MLTMKCVPVPGWARPFALSREEEFGEQEFRQATAHHGEMLEVVQEAVQQYADDDERVFSEEQQLFPQRTRLTGEYYIGREDYSIYQGPVHPPIRPEERKHMLSVMVRCLEKQWIENQTDFDYLGLEVFFWWEPAEQKFQYVGDIEPQVI